MSWQSNKKSGAGFTLVEMLVATAVFVLVGGVVLNLAVSSISGQRGALKNQAVVDQVSSVTEYMSRVIRQAKKDVDGLCLASGTNYEVFGVGQTLRILDKEDRCREFSYDLGTDVIQERLSIDETATFGSWVALISNDVGRLSLRFSIQGEDQTDLQQPRVTFFISVLEGFELQTTVSQRKFDVQE